MTTEVTAAVDPGEPAGDLIRRARVHAALADPTRLRIVDILSLSDASPTELQAVLGVGSNLLAHHVRLLEDNGLVVRHRSQADRRRSYLQLVPTTVEHLLAPTATATPVRRVVFVCTANSARSQLATALWEATSAVPATSAGTHPAEVIASGAVAAARKHGLTLANTRPKHLDAVLRRDDFVVTVCDNAHEELPRSAPPSTADRLPDEETKGIGVRRLHWSVPDPVRLGTEDAFDATLDDLARRVTHLAPRLIAS